MTINKTKKLLLASTNQGKVREISLLLGNQFKVLSLSDVFAEVPHYEEVGTTFKENAESKALFFNKLSGIPTVADDSGLSVNSLHGAPGVLSARWAGERASDEEKNQKLLQKMKGIPPDQRQASFICCAAFVSEGNIIKTIAASVEGIILSQMKGAFGFGYDPVFYYQPLNKTFAEMTTEEKNRYSHRGRAFRELADFIKKYFAEN
jgi:XTP/dITP diphosphohydrolase